ncbi:DUF2339 domain-containing protein [Acinetobacter radioresistens]|uniref:DUF2339 domain-containing protein n=1 Tax=Acinetobacter radioresistens TaxID=40216 RepID=UPI000D0AE373|nr:DUF2339 domain-containing protein [Acinetobacter radioresistens]PSD39114.1 DUF2339 domain-containing protein [Acinetobacter radioresistens]
MYNKDKQGYFIFLLIILVVIFAGSAVVNFELGMVGASLFFSILLIQLVSNMQQRLQQLEQRAKFIQPAADLVWQKAGIYASVLFGAVIYLSDWRSMLWLAIIIFIICLIHLLNRLQQRLANLEQHHSLAEPSLLPLPARQLQSRQEAEILSEQTSPSGPAHTGSSVTEPDRVPAVAPEPAASSWWQPAINWMVHGNPILRVAVAVLMIGVILLLRFASEHWQLSLGFRLGFIACIGGAITFFGYSLQKRNLLFAVALQGVGLAVIFLTLVFAHHYGVITSLSIASMLFAALLIVTSYLSLKQHAVYLAILALGMAYAAPLVIPQYHPDTVFLLGYYLLINLAVAVVNFVQSWKILNHIAFFVTMLLGGSVIVIYSEAKQYLILDLIIWLHILLFIWLSIRYSQLIARKHALSLRQLLSHPEQEQGRLQPLLDVSLIFSVPVLGFSLHAWLMRDNTFALTLGAALLALIYAGLTLWIRQRQQELSLLAKSFFILSVAFIALIFPLAQGAHWSTIGWVVQGAALIVWGVTERYRFSRYIGVALLLLSSVTLFYQIWSQIQFPVLSTAIYAFAQLISVYYLLQHQPSEERYFSSSVLSCILLALGLYAGAAAAVHSLGLQGQGLSPYLAMAALLSAVFTAFMHWKTQVNWLLVQLFINTLFLLFLGAAIWQENLWTNLAWSTSGSQYSFLFASAVTAFITLWTKPEHNSQSVKEFWAAVSWLLLAVTGLAILPTTPFLALGLIPAFYGAWVIYSKTPLLMHSITVWCLSLLWLTGLSIDVQVAEYAYWTVILNPADLLSIGVMAGLLWAIYQYRFHDKNLEWTFKIGSILVSLLVMSSIMVRGLHHYMGTPLWGTAIWSNGTVQLSLTLLWVILAFILMTLASRRLLRQIWFIGAALLAIVVAKLVFLDLSQSGTITRVFSFIGAGIVMLIIAYLAPLPPAIQQSTDDEPKV